MTNLAQDPDNENMAKWRCNLHSISANLDTVVGWPSDHVMGRTYTGPTCLINGAKSPFLMLVSVMYCRCHVGYHPSTSLLHLYLQQSTVSRQGVSEELFPLDRILHHTGRRSLGPF